MAHLVGRSPTPRACQGLSCSPTAHVLCSQLSRRGHCYAGLRLTSAGRPGPALLPTPSPPPLRLLTKLSAPSGCLSNNDVPISVLLGDCFLITLWNNSISELVTLTSSTDELAVTSTGAAPRPRCGSRSSGWRPPRGHSVPPLCQWAHPSCRSNHQISFRRVTGSASTPPTASFAFLTLLRVPSN